jgi:hypothetical protein
MKARAISVDLDTPDADKSDRAMNSGDITYNAIDESDIYGDFDEVYFIFF